MRKFVLTLAVAAAAAVSLSACDAIDLTKQEPVAAPAATGAPAQNDATAAAEAPAAQESTQAATVSGVKVTTDATLGKVVTDWKGWTLYRFEKDAPKPSKSTCYEQCATQWPAVPWVKGMQVQGVDQALIGKVTRTDGSEQLTINGWPAYRYGGDKKPGDTKGQGVGGVWYAFTPEGKKAQPVTADNGGGSY